MPQPSPPQAQTLPQLLAALEAAVRAGHCDRALALQLQIEQRLVLDSADHQRIEREMRALLAGLGDAAAKSAPFGHVQLKDLQLDRSTPAMAAAPGDRVQPVWFGTNRSPLPEGGFGTARHGHTTLGRVLVHVPEAHRFGSAGSSFWQRLRRFDLRDDRLRVQAVEPRTSEAFYAELQAEMQAARDAGEAPQALVFLHGFNVSFEEAAIRAAQLGVDLSVPGATAFFSWPSRGTVAAYPVDEASIEASEAAITAFLVDFAARCGADKLHLVAHSMGNRGLLRALQRVAANAQTRGQLKFGQIFLAAPDVDRELFLDLAHLYPQHAERVTLYASDADRAVHASSKLHGAPRAGYFAPYTVAQGVDTVAVPDFDIDLLGHSFFAQAEGLLHDMHDLLRHGEPPNRRQRLQAVVHEGACYWRFAR